MLNLERALRRTWLVTLRDGRLPPVLHGRGVDPWPRHAAAAAASPACAGGGSVDHSAMPSRPAACLAPSKGMQAQGHPVDYRPPGNGQDENQKRRVHRDPPASHTLLRPIIS